MSILKFRVWDNYTRKMSLVANISFGDDGSARTVIAESAPKGIIYHPLIHGENGILMQFTGLLDGEGREIYEGDILQIEDAMAKVVFWGRPPEFGLDVFHNEDNWCVDWNLTDDSERMEVIGNIYENPELVDAVNTI